MPCFIKSDSCLAPVLINAVVKHILPYPKILLTVLSIAFPTFLLTTNISVLLSTDPTMGARGMGRFCPPYVSKCSGTLPPKPLHKCSFIIQAVYGGIPSDQNTKKPFKSICNTTTSFLAMFYFLINRGTPDQGQSWF